MSDTGRSNSAGWTERKLDERARRALERQLDYQGKKASSELDSDGEFGRTLFLRAQKIRQKIAAVRPIAESDKVLEVGSGAHGLVFGFGGNFGACRPRLIALCTSAMMSSWARSNRLLRSGSTK